MGPNARIELVDHAGRAVFLVPGGPKGQERYLIDVRRAERIIIPLSKNTRQLFDDREWDQLGQRNLLKRFRCIGTLHGQLYLTNVRGRTFRLTGPSENAHALIRLIEVKGMKGARMVQFSEDVTPKGIGYSLAQASWSGGSRVILDSRGLLHFQSEDRSIPEFSVVLSETQLSGWSADGRRWGIEYFHGKATKLTPDAAIWNDLICPFVRELP